MSYGASRKGGRGSYELRSQWRKPTVADDGKTFPSWPKLIERMRDRLVELPDVQGHVDEVMEFFDQHDALDCAEVFEEKQRHAQGRARREDAHAEDRARGFEVQARGTP